jgi:hypothetical protein
VTADGWVVADGLGLEIPAHPAAFRSGGAGFLTAAFRASGALSSDNHVVRVTRCDDCAGGSTGRKLWLSVEYARPQAGLHTDLFVKFSRDFGDPIRDRAKVQMASEVRFAQLSRMPGFPIAVPACLFAGWQADTQTGLLITQRIAFGAHGIEPHREKCRDTELPEALAHYQALLTAVARLAGAHRGGRLPADVSAQFPFSFEAAAVGMRAPYTAQQLANRVSRFAAFATAHPGLLPANLRAPAFHARLLEEVPRVAGLADAIRSELSQWQDAIALCHWNANVDNAWFQQGADGRLACGLMDWGCVGQMNVAMALWGAMSGAEVEMWEAHLDELLALFASEFHHAGGAVLDVVRLKRHLLLYAALMGTTWLLDAPAYLRSLVPDLDVVRNRFDPRIRDREVARTQLQMLTVFLNLWETRGIGALLAQSR